jgi:hypothetical protein
VFYRLSCSTTEKSLETASGPAHPSGYTDYTLDRITQESCFVSRQISSSPQLPDRLRGPKNPLFNGCKEVLSPRVNRPGSETDPTHPRSAEFINEWSYVSTLLRINAMRRDNISFFKKKKFLLRIPHTIM